MPIRSKASRPPSQTCSTARRQLCPPAASTVASASLAKPRAAGHCRSKAWPCHRPRGVRAKGGRVGLGPGAVTVDNPCRGRLMP